MTDPTHTFAVESFGDAWRVTIEQYKLVEDGSFGTYERMPDAEMYVTAGSAGDAIQVAEIALGKNGPKTRVSAIAHVGVNYQRKIVRKGR